MSTEITTQQVEEKTRLELMIEEASVFGESIMRENPLENFKILANRLFEIATTDEMFVYKQMNNENAYIENLRIEMANRILGQIWLRYDKHNHEFNLNIQYQHGLKEYKEIYTVEKDEFGHAEISSLKGKNLIIPSPVKANSECVDNLLISLLEKITEYKK